MLNNRLCCALTYAAVICVVLIHSVNNTYVIIYNMLF